MDDLKSSFESLYHQLVTSGWSPNEAAAEALSRVSSNACPPPPTTVESPIVETHVTLNLQSLEEWITSSQESGDFRPFARKLFQVFSNAENLNRSFLVSSKSSSSSGVTRSVVPDLIRPLAIQKMYTRLYGLDEPLVNNTLHHALEQLVSTWHDVTAYDSVKDLHHFFLILHHPQASDPDFRDIFAGWCKRFYYLPTGIQNFVRQEWAQTYGNDELLALVHVLQQFISIRLLAGENIDAVFAAGSVLALLYDMNEDRRARVSGPIIHAVSSSESMIPDTESSGSLIPDSKSSESIPDSKHPFATHVDFYNQVINSDVNLIQDYARSSMYRTRQLEHEARQQHTATSRVIIPQRALAERSFCDTPFLLDAASKARMLQIDSSIQQRTQEDHDLLRHHAFLLLRIRRSDIVRDTMVQLAQMKPEELKKPLKVKFMGEEGIDEGGVAKEFFHVILRELLDPTYGMFRLDEDTSSSLWFNPESLESRLEFELIGTLVGLAIYNGIILDLHFPAMVWKKLTATPLTVEDVGSTSLANGLRQLLNWPSTGETEGEDAVQSTFQRSFQLSRTSAYGEILTVDLCPNGSQVPVTQDNREAYVMAYVHYLCYESIRAQFSAFAHGFHLVCGGPALTMFRWEELELLVCGAQDPVLDFTILANAATYEDGYTRESPIVTWFWSIVTTEWTVEQRKRLLMFITGSDRVPIRGLSSMNLTISRQGPSSDRLPTAHTCFNHLLLPEYHTREHLASRLLLAIDQAEGFGLL